MQMPKGDLLKRLLARGKAAFLGGDEAMAGGGAFRTGRSGPFGQTAGGARANQSGMSSATDLELSSGLGQAGGPLSTEVQRMVPLDNLEKLKMMLANLSPAQKAALLAGGAGAGAGGLGGYMAGDSGE